ncbi:MAG: sigma-E processing peptidase SpoIIGA [Firmicutes bacterium]|nr:sigma-E processing peptidase SpoIIGA [Bacillota bacterium]
MTLYIESVIVDNFFITLLVALLSFRALSVSPSRVRIVCASLLGTAAALCYPLLSMHAAWLFLLKAVLAVGLCLILFYKKCKVLPAAGIFCALTFTFGGALFALGLIFYGDVAAALSRPVTNLPVGILIASGLLIYFFVKKITLKYKRVRDIKEYAADIQIDMGNATFTARAFLDTGNRLYDPETLLPVIVAGSRISLQILGDKGLGALLRGNLTEISPSARYISYTSANGSKSKLLIVQPKQVRFCLGADKHIIKDVALGLALHKFTDAVEYDVLLHPALLGCQKGVSHAKTA